MLLTLLPTAALAAGEAETYQKIDTEEAFTTGTYLMVLDSGYAVGALDGSWLSAVEQTNTEETILDPAVDLRWNISVTEDGAVLTDNNGVTVAPKGGNENGISSGDYTWAFTFADGTFRFAGVGEDTVTLASNKSAGSKFRAYKNATIADNPNGYPCDFTLYKLEGEGGGEVTPPDPEEPETISIAEALAAGLDTADLTVKGVVTLLDG